MGTNQITVNADWDPEAKVWVASSDDVSNPDAVAFQSWLTAEKPRSADYVAVS